MKRFLFAVLSSIMISSCLGEGEMGNTYTLNAHFQYADMNFYPDSTFFNTAQPNGFGYDALNFYHRLDPGKIWFDGGFLISRLEMPKSGNTEGIENNTYRSYLKNFKGWEGNMYLVYYQNPDPALRPEHSIEFPYTANGSCVISGCYVTNTVEVADSIKANFVPGDRLILKATGYLNGVKTRDQSIALAEYTVAKDSIVSSWTPFRLDALGEVEYVEFEVNSTNPKVPGYFCMDNLVAQIKISY
jgi:hypothetical protein